MDVESLKEAYWAIVGDCLVQFHRYAPAAAHRAVLDLRTGVDASHYADAPPPGYRSELFYHAEPFYVASDIAGRPLDLSRHRGAYDSLLRRHYTDAEMRPSPSADLARVAGA